MYNLLLMEMSTKAGAPKIIIVYESVVNKREALPTISQYSSKEFYI